MKQSSDEIDLSPFFKWLGSPQGHEVLSRVLSMFEDIKKVTIDRNAEQAKMDRQFDHLLKRRHLYMQWSIFVAAIICASLLTYFDKFNPTLSFFLGTLVGFFFSKKSY
jgi:uncharacterized membrane protein YjjP (DUF1212 family)